MWWVILMFFTDCCYSLCPGWLHNRCIFIVEQWPLQKYVSSNGWTSERNVSVWRGKNGRAGLKGSPRVLSTTTIRCVYYSVADFVPLENLQHSSRRQRCWVGSFYHVFTNCCHCLEAPPMSGHLCIFVLGLKWKFNIKKWEGFTTMFVRMFRAVSHFQQRGHCFPNSQTGAPGCKICFTQNVSHKDLTSFFCHKLTLKTWVQNLVSEDKHIQKCLLLLIFNSALGSTKSVTGRWAGRHADSPMNQ